MPCLSIRRVPWIAAFLAAVMFASPPRRPAEADELKEEKTAKAQPEVSESPVPVTGAAREAWIAQTTAVVREGEEAKRRAALALLVEHDKTGDCLRPMIRMLADPEMGLEVLIDVIRTLAIPQLDDAALPLAALLDHEDARARGNAAVSLEYVGIAGSVDALRKQLGTENVPAVRNHLCRALGRCGAGDRGVRSLLLKQLGKAESDYDRIGPAVGLAYFEGDKSAARKLEKALLQALAKRRRGAGISTGRTEGRLMAWCLGEIGDPKSASFLRTRVLDVLRRESLLDSEPAFYEAVVRQIEGDPSAREVIDRSVFSFRGMGGSGVSMTTSSSGALFEMDDMRKGRDTSRFHPKGDPRSPQPKGMAAPRR